MRLSEDRYEFIKGEVVDLFERYDVRCIPINGFELAYKIGITLIPYSSLSAEKRMVAMKISGDGFYLEDLHGNDIIYYNKNLSYQRINMTLLHEIAHCVLDHQGGSEEEEAEANFFAKYAAAPPPLIHRIRPSCPEEIEAFFCISHIAAIYAYNYYNKWITYGSREYTGYELRLLSLFKTA